MFAARFVAISLSLFTAAALSAGCSLFDDWHRSNTYAGTYSWGFEVSEFRKCGSSSQWWVTTSDGAVSEELVSTYRALRNDTMYQQVYLKVRGSISGRGQYGHVGAYEREINVDEIIEMRQLRFGECKSD